MEWTNEHDLQLLVELRARNLRGSPERGRIWEEITETLNSDQNLKFYLKDKRAGRDEKKRELVVLRWKSPLKRTF